MISDFFLGAIGGALIAFLFFLATGSSWRARVSFRGNPRPKRPGTPLIPALEAILSRRKREFDTLAVRGHLTIGDDLFISVAVPAEVLEKSLDLVLGHALDAIKERPIREIRFVVEKEEHYCRVDVKDTGAGLPEEAWERIFEQSVPIDGVEIGENKRLHAARDVLAPYGGKVFIKHSIPDEETTIRIILPTLAGRTEAARVMENRPNFPHQRGGDVNHKEDF